MKNELGGKIRVSRIETKNRYLTNDNYENKKSKRQKMCHKTTT